MRNIRQYQSQGIESASNAQIVVLLFEKCVVRLQTAKSHMQTGERMLWLAELGKVRAIIVELMCALDHDTAPELTGNLHRTYGWVLAQLSEVGKSGQAEAIDPLLRVCHTLLDAFRTVVFANEDEEDSHADDSNTSESRQEAS